MSALAALLAALGISAVTATCTSHVFTADAWMVPPECLYGCENLVPLYFMNASSLAANVTGDNYPSLFSYDAHCGISRAKADNILPAGQGDCVGEFAQFSGVWWDAGARDTSDLFVAFFDAYVAAGGTLSRFAVRQNESMSADAVDAAGTPACFARRWSAMQSDARFGTDVAPALVSAGFKWDPSDPAGLFNALHGAGSSVAANRIVWDATMAPRVASYFGQSVASVVSRAFPGADVAFANITQWSAETCIPDADGVFYCDVGGGATLGNVEALDFFGLFTPGLAAAVEGAFGVTAFAPGAYNALLYANHNVRALAATAAAGVRVRPWLTYRSQPGSALVNSSFFQEVLFHAMLAGADGFQLLNNPGPDHASRDVPIVSNSIGEGTALLGCTERTPRALAAPGGAVAWELGFVLSAMDNVLTGGADRVYRFTPCCDLPDAYVVSTSPFAVSVPSVNGRAGNCSFTIEDGVVRTLHNPVSLQGFWISQPMTSPPAVVTCDGVE